MPDQPIPPRRKTFFIEAHEPYGRIENFRLGFALAILGHPTATLLQAPKCMDAFQRDRERGFAEGLAFVESRLFVDQTFFPAVDPLILRLPSETGK